MTSGIPQHEQTQSPPHQINAQKVSQNIDFHGKRIPNREKTKYRKGEET